MITLQRVVQIGRAIMPRGWSPLLKSISGFYPNARMYPAKLKNSDTFFLDMSEEMCHTCFYHGDLPYERFTEALLRTYLREGDVFLDVGANIGYFTRIASTLVGPTGHVHAFEPMPSAIRLLRKNSEHLANVSLYEIALSDHRGNSDFSVRKQGETSSLGGDPLAAEMIRVRTDTIDNLFSAHDRVDVIKIDVEGYEYEVLQGARATIQMNQPLLYFEFLAGYALARGLTIEHYDLLLKPLGYSLGWISVDYPRTPLISQSRSSYLIGVPTGNRWDIHM